MIRRLAFEGAGGFDRTLTHAEDQEWMLRLLTTTGWQAAGIDAPLVHYRTSRGGLPSDLDAMHAGWQAMTAKVRRYAPEVATAHEAEAEALFLRYLARQALRTGQPAGAAARHLARAVLRHPRALARHGARGTALTAVEVMAALLLPASTFRTAAA